MGKSSPECALEISMSTSFECIFYWYPCTQTTTKVVKLKVWYIDPKVYFCGVQIQGRSIHSHRISMKVAERGLPIFPCRYRSIQNNRVKTIGQLNESLDGVDPILVIGLLAIGRSQKLHRDVAVIIISLRRHKPRKAGQNGLQPGHSWAKIPKLMFSFYLWNIIYDTYLILFLTPGHWWFTHSQYTIQTNTAKGPWIVYHVHHEHTTSCHLATSRTMSH
jgi:hypothetical protein